MPTLIQGALHANSGRASARPRPYQAPGTYRQSVVQPILLTVSGSPGSYDGNPAAVVPADGNIPILLFCSDKPVLLRADSRYEDATLTTSDGATVVLPEPTYKEDVLPTAIAATVPFAALATTAGAATAEAGNVLRGTTDTNNVRVDGYAAEIAMTDRGLVNAQAAALTCQVDMTCIYQSGVIDGYVQMYTGSDAGGIDAAVHILMNEPLYTQLMQDAGDSFVIPGAPDMLVHIVGLFQLP